jgi:ABC-2 type transport system ATP-binding protein
LIRAAVPADGEPLLALDGLTVRFGPVAALSSVSAEFRGRAVGLLGPNGAGKTTLLRTLLGFHPPTAGTARILGHDIRTAGPAIRANVGYMPENDAFVAALSAVRTVRLLGELSGLPRRDALELTHEALNYVGLGEARYRPVGTYSLGMRQLVKLAQAIVHGPRLLLLDEPTNALDPPARERMLALIRDIRDSGDVQVIVCSHLLRDVEASCEEVAILKEGRLVARQGLGAGAAAVDDELELEAFGDVEALASALVSSGFAATVLLDRTVKVLLPTSADARDIYRIAAGLGIEVRRLSGRRDSLQDIFLAAMVAPEAVTEAP